MMTSQTETELRLASQDKEVTEKSNASVANRCLGTDLELEAPDPWPNHVDGDELLDDLVAIFKRFLALPEGAAETMALWVIHTHAHDAATISPLLALRSPERRCGKTTALRVIGALVPKSLPTVNITPAALFRSIEKWSPTLLIDEADNILRDNDELRCVLNAGHCRDQAFIIRAVGENYDPRRFCAWAPKAIALIGKLPETLEDRSLVVLMRRRRRDEKVDRLRVDREQGLTSVGRRCARWVEDNIDRLREHDPEVPNGIHDRDADNWTPLLAIADLAGGNWPTIARETAVKMCKADEDSSSIREILLADIRTVLDGRCVDTIFSMDLSAALAEMEGRRWGEWTRSGKPISPNGLANQLKSYGISPGTVRIGASTKKGYSRDQFDDAFSRYLPDTPSQSGTTSQGNGSAGYSPNRSVTKDPNVTVGKALKPNGDAGCDGVTVEDGEVDEERAAISEFDGGLDRATAEELARKTNSEDDDGEVVL